MVSMVLAGTGVLHFVYGANPRSIHTSSHPTAAAPNIAGSERGYRLGWLRPLAAQIMIYLEG